MAFTLATSLRDGLLDLVFGGTALSGLPSPDWTLSLWLGHPFDGGAEITGTGYAARTYPISGWLPASEGKSNTDLIRFPETGVAGSNWPPTPTGPDTQSYLVLGNGGTPLIAMRGYRFGAAGTLLANGDWIEIPPASAVLNWYVYPDTQPLAFSPDLRAALLDYLIDGTVWTPPPAWELALWKGSPFAGGVEINDPEYTRITSLNDGTVWAAASAGKSNVSALRWPAVGSPTRDWGRATHLCFCEAGASTPSVAILLSSSVSLRPGTPLEIDAGKLTIYWAY